MGSFVSTLLDPANIFGKRGDGMFNMADALDPGGAIIKAGTGSDIGRKIADPMKLYTEEEAEPVRTPGISESLKIANVADTKPSNEQVVSRQKLTDRRKALMAGSANYSKLGLNR